MQKALAVAASMVAILMTAGWLFVRDEVAAVRALATQSVESVPRNVRAAIIAAEGPSPIAFALVRSVTRPRRALRWHLETGAATLVISRMFTSEELLAIYAHHVYLGRIGSHEVRGVEAASRAYFGKPARDLTPAEAATIAGMLRSPSYYSPLKQPARAMERRNRVLESMHRRGFIDQREFERSIKQ